MNFLVNGQKVMIPFIYKSTDNMMIQMLKQKNAGYSTAAGDIQIFNDTTKELLYEIAEHVKLGSFSTFKISSYPANFLNAGQCIFLLALCAIFGIWAVIDIRREGEHNEKKNNNRARHAARTRNSNVR